MNCNVVKEAVMACRKQCFHNLPGGIRGPR